jgi:hypothetical protein
MGSKTVLIYNDKERAEYFRFAVDTVPDKSYGEMAKMAEEALWEYLEKDYFEEGDDEHEFYSRFEMVVAAHEIDDPHSIHFMK